jgi:hypothetical protein
MTRKGKVGGVSKKISTLCIKQNILLSLSIKLENHYSNQLNSRDEVFFT